MSQSVAHSSLPFYLPLEHPRSPWIKAIALGFLLIAGAYANYYLKGNLKFSVAFGGVGTICVLGGVGKMLLNRHREKVVEELNLNPEASVEHPYQKHIWIALIAAGLLFGGLSVLTQFNGGSEAGVCFFAGTGGICLLSGGLLALRHWNRYQALDFFLRPESQLIYRFKNATGQDLLQLVESSPSTSPFNQLRPLFPQLSLSNIEYYKRVTIAFHQTYPHLEALNEMDNMGDTILDRALLFYNAECNEDRHLAIQALAHEIYQKGGIASADFAPLLATYGIASK